MKIRVFGTGDCKDCKLLLNALNSKNISYSFVDALSPDTQEFCDKHNVNRLPHVQVIDARGKITYEKIGRVTNEDFEKITASL